MNTYNLKTKSAALYGDAVTNVILDVKSQLLRTIDNKVVPALELAIEGDDARRIHNIISEFNKEIYTKTGTWYDDIDYYEEYGDNLNGYVSLLIYRINEVFK